jgi:hypothetical protein
MSACQRPLRLLMILSLCFSFSIAQVRDYRGYKNIKKKKTLILPVGSATLSPPICKMLDENLITESVKTGVFDVINRYPDFILDNALGMPLEALDFYKLAEISDIEYIIRPKVEKLENTFRVDADIIDVKRITALASYSRECGCPFEDVVFLIMPELSDKMAKAKFDLEAECTANMVRFEKTAFTMGSSNKYDNNPEVQVRVSPFCMDKYEFPGGLGKDPAVEKSWNEADSLCKSAGKRLCTEFEWEYACRGKFNWFYPYGNKYNDGACNTEGKEAKSTGSFLNCHTEAQVYDMSGNLNEWTGSNWDANIKNKVIRGGAWFSGEKDSKCTLRFSNRPSTKAKAIGFRCCKSVN